MRKKLLSIILLILAGIYAHAQRFDFSAIAPSGQTLFYVINSDSTTVTVRFPSSSSNGSYLGYASPVGRLIIPDSVTHGGTTYSVTSIGGYAFLNNINLTSVVISNSITSIGNYAFYGCTNLEAVISDSVTQIGNQAFFNVKMIWYGGTATGTSWGALRIGYAEDSLYYTNNSKDTIMQAYPTIVIANIPNTVTTISDYAFSKCRRLSSVTIPNTVNSIGNYVFYNCTGLTSVTIPNTVNSIGNYVFYNCTGLTSVTIPIALSRIGDYAFYECTSLDSININYIRSIGNYAFYGCTDLNSINLNNIGSIGNAAFYGCTDLVSVKISIPSYFTTTIGQQAFFGCTGLDSVTIPNNVASIGNNAFYNVMMITYHGSASGAPWGALFMNGYVEDSLFFTSINKDTLIGSHPAIAIANIPNTVISIGTRAFYNDTNLNTVTIGNSVTSIGYNSFYGCNSLDTVFFNADSCISAEMAFENFTSMVFGQNVKMLPRGIFRNNQMVGACRMSNSIKTIGARAFSNCINLSLIFLSDSLITIEDDAFNGCRNLGSIYIPNTVTTIGDSAFINCDHLDTITIGNSVISIGNHAFSKCDRLECVYFNADSCIRAGSSLYPIFSRTSSNTVRSFRVVFGDNVKNIPDNMLKNSTVHSVYMSSNLKRIGYEAFFNCGRLSGSLIIPNSCNTIGGSSFSDCTGLTSITIPNTVTTIGGSAFSGCTNLVSVNIPDFVTTIETRTFYNCERLTTITIPDSVVVIGDRAFENCMNLSDITLGNSIAVIGISAFDNCRGLSGLTIPESVISIGDYAFRGWSYLDTLNFNAINCTQGGVQIFGPRNRYKSSIKILNIGNVVKAIPANFIRGCDSVTVVYMDGDSNQITSIGANAFDGCNNMAGHIVVPHITSLGDGAFSGCSMISSVELGNGLSAIGDTVFKGCDHMTNVTLGRGVQSIADNAFEGCTEIRLLTSRALNPPTIYRTTFEDVDDDISVRVPCEAVAAYQNAPFWSHFNNIEGRFDFFFSATSADITKGSVTIVHAPVCDNIEAHIQANPYHGYRFSHWSDGNTDNPRYIVVTQDTIITAHFESTEGIDSPLLHPAHYSQEGNRIVVNGAEGQSVRVFDIMGKLISSQPNVPEPFSIYLPAAGVYLIQIGSSTPQKIVVH